MASKTLEEFLQDRLRAYDPTIDLSSGSPADTQIVQPTVERYQPDPFEMPVEEFIDARMAQEFPDTNVQEGSGVKDLLIKPLQVLLDPVIRELQLIKDGQSLQYPDQLADGEVDAFAANLFVSRNTGDLAHGKARLFFNAPQAVRVSVGNVFYTADNLRFFPDRQQSISAESMSFNQYGNLYYFDVDVVAEQAGDEYNIDKELLVGVTNISVAVRVTNMAPFADGLPRESSADLISRAETSITERSLVTPRGVSARLRAEFPSLTQLQVIGYGDPEMNRDVLTGGDLGEQLLYGNDGVAVEDGATDSRTYRFGVLTGTLVPTGFEEDADVPEETPLYLLTTELKSGVGTIRTAHRDRLLVSDLDGYTSFNESDVGRIIKIQGQNNPHEFLLIDVVGAGYLGLVYPSTGDPFVGTEEIGTVHWVLAREQKKSKIARFEDGGTELVLADEPIQALAENFAWAIHRKELTISGVPTGLVLSSARENPNLSVRSDQVHIGGCSDFYVRGTSDGGQLLLNSIADESPFYRGSNGRTYSTDPYFFRDRPEPEASEADYSITNPTTVDFLALGVEPGDSLVVEEGPDAGTRTILRIGKSNTSGGLGEDDKGCLQVDLPFSSTQEYLRYKIVKSVTINLREPATLLGSGDQGTTTQGTTLFTTTDAVNFTGLGILAGDRLRILSGADAGEHEVVGVSGTGSRYLQLRAPLIDTAASLRWEIVRVQAGLNFPLLRVTSINVVDSTGSRLGFTVPYGKPVDVRSSAFSNIARGIKCHTTRAWIGIIGRRDLGEVTFPLSAGSGVYVHVDGASGTFVDLAGVTSVDTLLAAFNARLGSDVATILYANDTPRLVLRSATKWLMVGDMAGSVLPGNSGDLGIQKYDDNRQVISIDYVSSISGFRWTDTTSWSETPEGDRQSLQPETDVVQIKGAEPSRKYYLRQVYADRLHILDFDEARKIVRFPEPEYLVTVDVGSRSTGTVRVYFKDPTSMEVLGKYRPALRSTSAHAANLAALNQVALSNPDDYEQISLDEPEITYFTAEVDGATLRFIPDPSFSRVVIPDPTSSAPNNLQSLPNIYGGYLLSSYHLSGQDSDHRSADVDFLARRVRPGDLLDITYRPIFGVNPYNLSTLINKTMDVRIDGGASRRMTFTDQLTAGPADTWPGNLVTQLNDFFGAEVAGFDNSGYVKVEADFLIEVAVRGISHPDYATWAIPSLGWEAVAASLSTRATDAGSYTISSIGQRGAYNFNNNLLLENMDDAIHSLWNSQHFVVRRAGSQRIHSTAMADNVENGLYYMDVELLSDGTGDQFNIPAGTVLTVDGYSADGYHLSVVDPNLSFSTEEEVSLVITRQVLMEGETDDLTKAMTMPGQNIQIDYEYSSLVEQVQLFASSELDRVVTASLLVRHLFPAYLYFELTYQGGSSVDVVQQDVSDFITALGPNDSVQSSAVQRLATRRGATYVENPLEVVSVGTDASRNLSVERSLDTVTHGRLSTFFPGTITVSKV